MIEPQSFEDNVIYLIGEITRLTHKRVSSIFLKHQFDVTVEQFGVLAVLWYQEGINLQTLSERLNRDKTTITRIIQNMIKKNLLVKVPDQMDKRNKLVYLTEKGKKLQKIMIDSTGVVYTDTLKNVSASDVKIITKVLQKMKNNLNK